MLHFDEDALVCDLAETYHIYDYKQLSPSQVAVFSLGLRENSRIKMKLAGQKVPLDTLLLAGVADRLSVLLWTKTKDAQKNKNRPPSILESFLEEKAEKSDKLSFASGEDFEVVRQKLIGKGGEESGN